MVSTGTSGIQPGIATQGRAHLSMGAAARRGRFFVGHGAVHDRSGPDRILAILLRTCLLSGNAVRPG